MPLGSTPIKGRFAWGNAGAAPRPSRAITPLFVPPVDERQAERGCRSGHAAQQFRCQFLVLGG